MRALLFATLILGVAAAGTGDAQGQLQKIHGNAQQVTVVLPQFLASPEFQSERLNVKDPATATTVVARAFQSFFARTPTPAEAQKWQIQLTQSGDLRPLLETIINSPEYTAKKKGVDQGIVDLYEATLGRLPSATEVNTWKQQLARQ